MVDNGTRGIGKNEEICEGHKYSFEIGKQETTTGKSCSLNGNMQNSKK